MVVREPARTGVSQASMHSTRRVSSSTRMEVGRGDEEDSSGSSDTFYTTDSGHGRGRRQIDETEDDKRRRNREAAKRCRDKKQKQTEDLKVKNTELEKENCQLAKQRDELIRKCKDYQREIEQHKQQGCVVLHFNPPYSLDHLMQPSSPPSPAYSESAPSTSSCPSPAPSISPGPPARHLPQPMQDTIFSGGVTNHHAQAMARGTASREVTSVPTSTCPLTGQSTSEAANKVYHIRVRNKDGSRKILALDKENYLKVMQRVKAAREAAAAKVMQEQQEESMQTSAATATFPPDTSFQLMPLQQEQAESLIAMNPKMPCLRPEEEQEPCPRSEQKLDTCEDLISILKAHVKNTDKGFILTPVSESEVDVPIKQEPPDVEYEQKRFLTPDGQVETVWVKQENTGAPTSSGAWTSSGQQTRTSLESQTNPTGSSSHNAQIENILQFLKTDEHNVAGAANSASSAQQSRQTARQNPVTLMSTSRPAQTATYVTSSATVGSLNKMRMENNQSSLLSLQGSEQQIPDHIYAQQGRGVQDASGGQQSLIKLRPNAASLALGRQPQAVSVAASSAIADHISHPVAPRMNTTVAGRMTMTSSSGTTVETQPQSVAIPAGSLQTCQGPSDSLMLGQQLNTSVAVQPATTMSFQQSTSTIDTSAIDSFPLQGIASSDNLMSESTSQIAEYLKTNSLEALNC